MATILLVEDAEALGEVIKRELEANGYEVRWAKDGGEGLTLHDRHAPDLLVLDWMLPTMDGLEVLRRLRQRAATPVLMLTARGEETDRIIGLEVGADDYLTKPFSMREMIARVRALLRRATYLQEQLRSDRDRGGETITRGGLFFDPVAHIATLDGAPIELSRTEFALLHLFLKSPGRAFSREYLLDTVWGVEYVGGDRSIDNAVLRLRKKLGALGEEIETVWGIGYRMKTP